MPRLLVKQSEPTYEHDCKSCVYLGSDAFFMTGEGTQTNRVDMYIHLNPSGRHVLLRRYSSEPGDYSSFTPSDWSDPKKIPAPARTVMTLAQDRGYIDDIKLSNSNSGNISSSRRRTGSADTTS